MIKIKRLLLTVLSGTLFFGQSLFAGNPDRAGQAGAYELLINPFARSSGWGGINFANANGFEAMRLNVAGLSSAENTEVSFTKDVWLQLQGANIGVSDLAFAQKLGKNGGVLGINLLGMSFGDIPITTTGVPDVVNGQATLGTFKPQYYNFSLCYSKKVSQSIQGGFGITGISEQIPNAKAQGLALDAGIQYTPVAQPQIHFGISLRNVGVGMGFGGDGISFTGASQGGGYTQVEQMRTAQFELPSQLNIGGAYDFKFNKIDENYFMHRLTIDAAFISNSYSADQYGIGAEYCYREMFMLHAGYRYQSGMLSNTQVHTNVYTGVSAGFTFIVPLKKDGPKLGLDYSYRTTNPFFGTHSIGVSIAL